MLLVDDLAAGGTKNLRHTPRGLVTLSSLTHLAVNNVRMIGMQSETDKLLCCLCTTKPCFLMQFPV